MSDSTLTPLFRHHHNPGVNSWNNQPCSSKKYWENALDYDIPEIPVPTNQACPKSQSTCSTFGTSKLTHIISPFPSKRISTTTPKVKESPWLSEDSANTDISIDSDRDNREKDTNVCVTSAEPEFTLKHEALKNYYGSIHVYEGC